MTTVGKLIEELEKMPKGLPVSLNIDKNGFDIAVYMSEIKVEEHDFETYLSDPGTKQRFVILNQKGA